MQKNFQYTLIFIFYHQSKYLLITQLSSIFYFLFSLFYCLYCTKRKTTVKHFLFPFLFLSIRLSTVIFCFFFRTISHFAYNNCSPVDAIRIHLFTMPRKDVKKRLFLSNSCIDNSGQNWYTRVKMSDTISSRLNYSIKLSNRAVTPPPSIVTAHKNTVSYQPSERCFFVSFFPEGSELIVKIIEVSEV